MTVLGTITLWLTPLLAIWSVLLGLLGLRRRHDALLESSRRAAVAEAAVLAIVVVSLVTSLVRRDFSISYVADHSSRNLDMALTVAAIAAGWNGALLTTLLAFSLLSIPALWVGRPRASETAVVTSGLVLLAAAALIAFGNPFTRLAATPLEGHGLNPRLRDLAFLLESPLAILGYAALGVVLTSAIASRLFGAAERMDPERLGRWLAAAWLSFTASLTLGLWHAQGMNDAGGSPDWGTARDATLSLWLVATGGLCAAVLPRRRPSRGSLVAGAGAVLVIAGVWGWHAGPERELSMKSGGTATVTSPLGASYLLTHMGVSRFETSDRIVVAATLDLERNGAPAGLVTSERRQHYDMLGQKIGEAVTTVGVRHGILEDVRAVAIESSGNEQARYRVRVSPLMSLIWLGAGLLMLGGVILFAELSA